MLLVRRTELELNGLRPSAPRVSGPTIPSATSPWPTLTQLIANGRRVVVFYETDGQELARPAWYHPLHDEVLTTAYGLTDVSQFGCSAVGGPNAQLYLVNHFLSEPAGWEHLARQANPWTVVLDHASRCESTMQLPNVVAVDFYELDENSNDSVYSVVRIADYLNGV